MIWKNAELFNAEAVEVNENGALRMLRFPKDVTENFGRESGDFPMWVSRLTTGCEIRFVCDAADVYVMAPEEEGCVEIFRGDFLVRTQRLAPGVSTRIYCAPEAVPWTSTTCPG